MEENENKSVEEEAVQPTREEILSASRRENKNGDERDNKIYLRAYDGLYGNDDDVDALLCRKVRQAQTAVYKLRRSVRGCICIFYSLLDIGIVRGYVNEREWKCERRRKRRLRV